MKFNDIVDMILSTREEVVEDFRTPFDSKRRVTAPRANNFSTPNPVFNKNQSTGTTDAASGFLGDTNTKMHTPVFRLPRSKKKKLKLRRSDKIS